MIVWFDVLMTLRCGSVGCKTGTIGFLGEVNMALRSEMCSADNKMCREVLKMGFDVQRKLFWS